MTDYSLLEGAIELHAHASPSIFPRKQSDRELLTDVVKAGMAGIVIKSHESQTVDRAATLREQEPGMHVYGGLTCNYFTGGLSPSAVDASIRLGAKVIWMPTISSHQHRKYFARANTGLFATQRPLVQPASGLGILNDAGHVTKNVHDMLELIARADIILATGHLSPKEVAVLVPVAIEHGVRKILIQHPDMGIAPISIEQQLDLAAQGAYIEKCYLACGDDFNDLTVAQMARSIEQIGPKSCVLVSDYGQAHNIPVVQALNNFTNELFQSGISKAHIRQMIVDNPTHLLGL